MERCTWGKYALLYAAVCLVAVLLFWAIYQFFLMGGASFGSLLIMNYLYITWIYVLPLIALVLAGVATSRSVLSLATCALIAALGIAYLLSLATTLGLETLADKRVMALGFVAALVGVCIGAVVRSIKQHGK